MTLTKFVRASAATVGALAMATQVNAADLYSGGGMKDAPVFVPPSIWTGFYLGAHVGGVWARHSITTDYRRWLLWYLRLPLQLEEHQMTACSAAARSATTYQTGAFVVGVEADFGGIGL